MKNELDLNQLRYENIQLIGKGAFSRVYQIKDQSTGKVYALKKIDLERLTEGDKLNLQSEIEIHKKLKHKNVIEFYGMKQTSKEIYIILQIAQNGNLFEYIDQ